MRNSEKQWGQMYLKDGIGDYWQRRAEIDETANGMGSAEEFGTASNEVKMVKKKIDRA